MKKVIFVIIGIVLVALGVAFAAAGDLPGGVAYRIIPLPEPFAYVGSTPIAQYESGSVIYVVKRRMISFKPSKADRIITLYSPEMILPEVGAHTTRRIKVK